MSQEYAAEADASSGSDCVAGVALDGEDSPHRHELKGTAGVVHLAGGEAVGVNEYARAYQG